MARRRDVRDMPSLVAVAPYDPAAELESQPLGGYYNEGNETLDALDDRVGGPTYSHRHNPNIHCNRTLAAQPENKIGSVPLEEGVSFRAPLRSDLDDENRGF